MDISKHISSLLFHHDCVIVPGLGGFVGNYHPAKIHPVQHLFQPPFKTILFNPELKNNDGLLANAIAEKENISYSGALAILDDFSKRTLATIQSGSKVELENIGELFLGIEGNILFLQDEKYNYLRNAYGLSSFISPAISRSYRGMAQKPATKFVNRREASTQKKPTRIAMLALLLIPLFIVLGLLSVNTGVWDGLMNTETGIATATKPESKTRAISNDKAFTDAGNTALQPESAREEPKTIKPENASFVPEMNIEEPLELPKDNTTDTDTNTGTTPDQVPPPPAQTPQQKMYHLIGGSFENIENAEILILSYKEKGYENSKVVGQAANGFYRVSISAYIKKSEAITELTKVRTSLNPQAWLLRQ
jgi:cell division protein FtsN